MISPWFSYDVPFKTSISRGFNRFKSPTPGLWMARGQSDCLIAISQSGETADTLEAIKMAKEHKARHLNVSGVNVHTISLLIWYNILIIYLNHVSRNDVQCWFHALNRNSVFLWGPTLAGPWLRLWQLELWMSSVPASLESHQLGLWQRSCRQKHVLVGDLH